MICLPVDSLGIDGWIAVVGMVKTHYCTRADLLIEDRTRARADGRARSPSSLRGVGYGFPPHTTPF
jgi:hypothetical protein